VSAAVPFGGRRRGARCVAILVLAAGLAACGGGASPLPSPTTGPSAVATIPLPASPVTGVVIEVSASGLADVSGMTLRLADGRALEFRIGSLENGAEFPPGHLKEHMATSTPVRVWFRLEGTELVAYRIEDAG
jgi:hypothetical protein